MPFVVSLPGTSAPVLDGVRKEKKIVFVEGGSSHRDVAGSGQAGRKAETGELSRRDAGQG